MGLYSLQEQWITAPRYLTFTSWHTPIPPSISLACSLSCSIQCVPCVTRVSCYSTNRNALACVHTAITGVLKRITENSYKNIVRILQIQVTLHSIVHAQHSKIGLGNYRLSISEEMMQSLVCIAYAVIPQQTRSIPLCI